jgi:energy-coupling factor transporter ATP-binding protein EcfA2
MKLFINKENGQEYLYFGFELLGTGRKPLHAKSVIESEQWMEEHCKWRSVFATLFTSPPAGKIFELVFSGGGTGEDSKLKVCLYCKFTVDNYKMARLEAKQVYDALFSLLHMNRSVYLFKPLTKKKDLLNHIRQFDRSNIAELLRKGLKSELEKGIGFSSFKPLKEAASLPYPLTGPVSDLFFLCRFIAEHPQRIAVSVRVKPYLKRISFEDLGQPENKQGEFGLQIANSVAERLKEIERYKLKLCCLRAFISVEKEFTRSVEAVMGREIFSANSNYWQVRNLCETEKAIALNLDDDCSDDYLHLYSEEEAARIFRLPVPGYQGVPGLKLVNPFLPDSLPAGGTVLGFKQTDQGKRSIKIGEIDRDKHIYVLGQTGTGKTTLLYSMAMSDIREGRGLCVLDPHDDLHERLISRLPDYRCDDVVLLDPNDFDYTVGLNLLEGKTERERIFFANELIQIIRMVYDPASQGMVGPIFEQAVRFAALTAMYIPGGGTVIDIPHLLTNRDYVKDLIKLLPDQRLTDFWEEIWFKHQRDYAELLAYITSKFDNIQADPYMRRTLGQAKSTLNFRQMMDDGKIVLVNLSKGVLGEVNSHLIGSILVSLIFSAALSRYDLEPSKRKPFYLYIDEFQNFTTRTIHSMLSEARKYRLSLVLAHQNLKQLSEETRHVVLGNVGSLIFFRPGPQDSSFAQEYLKPDFGESDLLNLPNWTAIGRLMVDSKPARPFTFQVDKDRGSDNYATLSYIRKRMRTQYARHYKFVEDQIRKRQSSDIFESSQHQNVDDEGFFIE